MESFNNLVVGQLTNQMNTTNLAKVDEYNIQKNSIKIGLKYISFVNEKITDYQFETFDDINVVEESKHTVSIRETSINNGIEKNKSERIFSFNTLTMLYDLSTGYIYALGKTCVLFYKILYPSKVKQVSDGKLKHTKPKQQRKRTEKIMGVQQHNLPIAAYNGIGVYDGVVVFWLTKTGVDGVNSIDTVVDVINNK